MSCGISPSFPSVVGASIVMVFCPFTNTCNEKLVRGKERREEEGEGHEEEHQNNKQTNKQNILKK